MANWTVSSSTTSIAAGASVSGSTKVLTITPKTGYVVSASNFKIGNGTETSSGSKTWTTGAGSWNADSGISQVVFADTGTAGTATNTVTATVTFSSFTMPSSNKTLYLDIDEVSSTEAELRPVCIRSKHLAETNVNSVNKHTVTTTSPAGITETDDSSTVGANGTHTHFHKGDVVEDPTAPGNLIFTKVFAANTTYGYFYNAAPTYTFAVNSGYGDYSNYYTIVQSGEVYTNVTVGGVTSSELTSVTFKLYYTPPTNPTTPSGLDPDPFSTNAAMCELNQYVQFDHVIRQEDQGQPGSKKYITDVNTPTTYLDNAGETRTVRVSGDPGSIFKLVVTITDNSNTYDFTSNTFTAGATTSAETTLSSVGYQDFDIIYPATSSTDTYDITVVATSPTSTLINVPTTAGDLRLTQYANIVVTLGFQDLASPIWGEAAASGDIFGTGENTYITLTGEAGQQIQNGVSRAFSYTVKPSHLDAGSGTLAPRSGTGFPDFTLTNVGSVTTLVDGNISSTTFDVDSTTGIVPTSSIDWSIQKMPTVALEEATEIIVGTYVDANTLVSTPNVDNLVVGMKVTARNISSTEVVIESIGTNSIVLSEAIETNTKIPITFTSDGITVSSVTDSNTLVSSQDLSGVKDDFSLTFGGSSDEQTRAYVVNGTATQASANVVVAGTLVVENFGNASETVKMELEKIISVS